MNSALPRLSYRGSLEHILRATLEGAAAHEFVEKLTKLARNNLSYRRRMLARMAMNAALAEATKTADARKVQRLIRDRTALGFRSMTDVVFSFQPVVVGAMRRTELRETAFRLLEEIARRARHSTGIQQRNARLFVSRMTVELNSRAAQSSGSDSTT